MRSASVMTARRASQQRHTPELLMDLDLLADLARLRLPAPHLIQEVHVEEDEEALFPLDDPFMHQLPLLNDPEFALNAVSSRHQGAGPSESSQSYVNRAEDWRPWPEYKAMNYEGVEEEIEEEWNFLQQLEIEPEENVEDEINTQTSQQGLIAVSLGTKRMDPITEEDMLLQGINPSAPHIATMGFQEPAMPDATPVFGPTLEPVPHQQQV